MNAIETTKIPNEVLHDRVLIPHEKLVLISLITHKHPVMTADYLFYVVFQGKISTIKLKKVIESLEEKEWVMVRKYNDPAGHEYYAISINWFKIYQPDKSQNFPLGV